MGYHSIPSHKKKDSENIENKKNDDFSNFFVVAKA